MVISNNIQLNNFIKYQNLEYKNKINKILEEINSENLRSSLGYVLDNNGKMLRPLLFLFSAKVCGGDLKKMQNAAVSLELLHNFMLVHDDIMDSSEKRRGKITLYKKYGLNKAILAGDVLFALAYKNIIMDCSHEISKDILNIFTNFVIKIGEGQSLDDAFETKENISIIEYKKMIYKKTAIMTEMSCYMAARINNASATLTKALSNYGKYLGMAFQIQNDIQDIFGDGNIPGKEKGGDFMKGKKTYLFVKATLKAKGKDKNYLSKMSKGCKSLDEIIKYRNLCIKLGVLDAAELEVNKYLKLAKKSLKFIPESEGKYLMICFLDKMKL